MPRDAMLRRFGDERPMLRAGRPGKTITVDPEHLNQLVHRHLITAAGLDTVASDRPLPDVLWTQGTNRLVVHLARTSVRCGDGFVDVAVTVECDQTGMAEVVTTFVTAAPSRPGGFVWATESLPRGPQPVVQVWGDALIALGWRALVEVATEVADAGAVDQWGRGALAATVVAGPGGLMVRPAAAPRFMSVGVSGVRP